MLSLGGCVELGVITDGTSVSIGRPSRGYLLDGKRLPDRGEGFTTGEVWRERGNRYGTDEMLDLITAIGRRMTMHFRDVRLLVADLSLARGGAAKRWHRSHQSGRDVDLVYYMRDRDGRPLQADAMRAFDAQGRARDGSGITVDVPRMWLLVKELVTAPEAIVQYVFIYEPIAAKILEHAAQLGEPEALIARARMTLKQPGDSAPHDDHVHVRIYCSARDRAYGCIDIGPLDVLAQREAERRLADEVAVLLAALLDGVARADAPEVLAATAPAPPMAHAAVITPPGRELSALSGALYLRRWLLGR